jgi:hypothetical protein
MPSAIIREIRLLSLLGYIEFYSFTTSASLSKYINAKSTLYVKEAY